MTDSRRSWRSLSTVMLRLRVSWTRWRRNRAKARLAREVARLRLAETLVAEQRETVLALEARLHPARVISLPEPEPLPEPEQLAPSPMPLPEADPTRPLPMEPPPMPEVRFPTPEPTPEELEPMPDPAQEILARLSGPLLPRS